MKRFFGAAAALALCLGLCLSVRAAGRGKLSLRCDAEGLARGDAFTVILQCNRNPGVKEMRLTLAYDRQALEVLEIEDLGLFPGGKVDRKENEDVLSFKEQERGKNFDLTGNVARIRFRVKDDAPYGTSRVSVSFSERMMDIRDASGTVVPFDVQEWGYTLICPHARVERETITPATLSAQGVARVVCADCGESWEEVLMPEIRSEDGKLRAVVAPGIFAEGTDPVVSVEYIFGGADSDAARTLFGTRLIRAFRIRFAVSGGNVLPLGEVMVTLESEVELPEYVSLYSYDDGFTERQSAEIRGNEVTFPWRDVLFLLVSTPPEEEPRETDDDEPAPEAEPVTTTLSPEEEKSRRDGITLAVSGAVLLVTGAGIYFLLRKARKRF